MEDDQGRRSRDLPTVAIHWLGAIAIIALLGLTAIALLRPEFERDSGGVLTLLGTIAGAIGGIAVGRHWKE